MLILQGGRALSPFRIQSLINRAKAVGIDVQDLVCTYLFFVIGEVRDADKLKPMIKTPVTKTWVFIISCFQWRKNIFLILPKHWSDISSR